MKRQNHEQDQDQGAGALYEPPPRGPEPEGDDPHEVEETWEEYMERVIAEEGIVDPVPQPPEPPGDPDNPDL